MGRKYYKKKNHSREPDLGDIFGIISAVFIFLVFLYWRVEKSVNTFFDTYIQQIYIFGYITISILIIILVLGGFSWVKKRKKKTEMIQGLIGNVVTEITEFKPLKRYREELPYQMELAGYLRKTFPTLSIEENKEGTRPDIIVEDIAIEIKGPTRNGELRTIADKIIRYLKHYDKLIVVLFTLEVPQKEYEEWKEDIENTFENKKEKLFILDI